MGAIFPRTPAQLQTKEQGQWEGNMNPTIQNNTAMAEGSSNLGCPPPDDRNNKRHAAPGTRKVCGPG
jgi:hypothetical protein